VADDQEKALEGAGAPSDGTDAHAEAAAAEAADFSSWGNLWQVPAIVISLVLIGLGLLVASHRGPKYDFGGALDQVDQFIVAGEFETAKTRLEMVIEPNLDQATPAQEARFHVSMADWVAAVQEARGTSTEANNHIIVTQYAEGVSKGAMLTAPRLERWANALIDLGELEEARKRVAELAALSVSGESGGDAQACRNRLLRRLVEVSLQQEELPEEAIAAVLNDYRRDSMITPADEAWVIARQAEQRLEAGDARQAVDYLLVDMRRLEGIAASLDAAVWGELYTLLARGYFDQGLYDYAEFHLRQALGRFGGSEPAQADAMLLLGRLAIARGETDEALERFDEVVRDFPGAPAHAPAILARAEARSIAGDHEASLEDFRALLKLLPEAGPRRDITARTVAASLADRHDAALITGQLDLAFEYVSLAEALFAGDEVPVDVLFRIASTSRQIADNIITEAMRSLADEGRRQRLDEIDPATRYEAQARYERAGDYFLRHARALTTVPEADEQWAESLWLAGDSYDLAARRELAIRHFLEYIAGCSVDDPRRAEVTFRLAAAYEAQLEYESSATYYEQVINEHPRSVYGTQSHVPLARCYVALDRLPEAEQQLLDVVENRQGRQTPVTPESLDYRDALIALGKFYYDTGQYTAAIERLTLACQRYGEDERIHEIRFRLADSYRRQALALRGQPEGPSALPPARRRALDEMARQHLETALGLFEQVSGGYADIDEARLDRLQRDYQRYAALYRGDCAFALGRYDQAAQLYDQAARKYGGHHSSMYALVQIVNCYDRLGDGEHADVAHHRALEHLSRLPDEAFADPQALLDRAAWEQWLRNRPLGLARVPEAPSPN
jgi:tetratricopeptide (TPR) repeat protein